MSKIFNIYLNSRQKISGNNTDATYFIDWSSVLPCGKYKCSFIGEIKASIRPERLSKTSIF